MNTYFLKSFSKLFFPVIILCFAACNTTDTGISKPFPDCFDGIQNQGETSIDCGGPCLPCPPKVTAKIDGVPWESGGNVSGSVAGNQIQISSANGTATLNVIHQGPFEAGSYNLYQALYMINSPQTTYISNQGTITFLTWDPQNKVVSGTFSFTAFEASGVGDTIQVTDGTFESVIYQP